MILPHVFNVQLEDTLTTFCSCSSLPSQKGTTQILHLSKFANEPQDIEQNAQQTKAEIVLGHIFTIRCSVTPFKRQKTSYGQYENEAHCPPAFSPQMNQDIKRHNRLEKKQQKGLHCCSSGVRSALLQWGKKLFRKEEIFLLFFHLLSCGLTNSTRISCHFLVNAVYH